MRNHKGILNLGVWQGESKSGNVVENIKKIELIAKQASECNVNLLVFPECFLTGYYTNTDIKEIAVKINSARINELYKIAVKYRLTLVIGSYQMNGNLVHNVAFVLDPELGLIGTYRKQMLYGDWEKNTFIPGTAPLIFECAGIKVGVLICFDVEFPEKVRQIASMGAELLVVPTALMKPYKIISSSLIPTRALENGIYVAYANRTGNEGPFHYVGHSCIVGPDGKDLDRFGESEEKLMIIEIDRKNIDIVRSDISYLYELSQSIM